MRRLAAGDVERQLQARSSPEPQHCKHDDQTKSYRQGSRPRLRLRHAGHPVFRLADGDSDWQLQELLYAWSDSAKPQASLHSAARQLALQLAAQIGGLYGCILMQASRKLVCPLPSSPPRTGESIAASHSVSIYILQVSLAWSCRCTLNKSEPHIAHFHVLERRNDVLVRPDQIQPLLLVSLHPGIARLLKHAPHVCQVGAPLLQVAFHYHVSFRLSALRLNTHSSARSCDRQHFLVIRCLCSLL